VEAGEIKGVIQRNKWVGIKKIVFFNFLINIFASTDANYNVGSPVGGNGGLPTITLLVWRRNSFFRRRFLVMAEDGRQGSEFRE
jgi:hypothetical protein